MKWQGKGQRPVREGLGGPGCHWRGQRGLFHGDDYLARRTQHWDILGASRPRQTHPSGTQASQLTVALTSLREVMVAGLNWNKAFLFPVSPAICLFFPFFLLFSEAPQPSACLLPVTSSFVLWAFANRGLVDTSRCLKTVIRSVNTHLQQHHSCLPQKLLVYMRSKQPLIIYHLSRTV